MKNTRFSLSIVALGLIAMVFAARLLADDAGDAATIATLCSQPWQITGVNWFAVRTFQKEGTFTTEGSASGGGTWQISWKTIVLTFADKHTEVMVLPLDPDGTAGIDANDRPTNAVQLSPPPLTPSPEVQRKAADIVSSYGDGIVVVAGKGGAGSGFIAVVDKSNFLVTNVHVVLGAPNISFTTLGNTVLPAATLSVAMDRDVFRMAAPAGGKPFEIMQDVDKNAAVGDDVVVLGNAEGAGVMTAIPGNIVKIAPDCIEVNAPFVPGNSGSPIVHIKSGKVIAIATFHRIVNGDAVADSAGAVPPVVRRYGYRLDNIKGWQTVEWRSFTAQSVEIEKIEALTRALYSFMRQLGRNGGSPNPDSQTDLVVEKFISQWESDASHTAGRDGQAMVKRRFLTNFWAMCQADIATGRQHLSYAFFQGRLADQLKDRQEIYAEIQKIIKPGN